MEWRGGVRVSVAGSLGAPGGGRSRGGEAGELEGERCAQQHEQLWRAPCRAGGAGGRRQRRTKGGEGEGWQGGGRVLVLVLVGGRVEGG
jgi:hypothetical protein